MTKAKYVPEGATKAEKKWMWIAIAVTLPAITYMLYTSTKRADQLQKEKDLVLGINQAPK